MTNVLTQFAHNYAHKLLELDIYGNVKPFLELCPKLKKVDVFGPNTSCLIDENKDFSPQLERMSTIKIKFNEFNKMKILSDKYSKTIKTLDVIFKDMSYEELKTCIDYICRFENLKELKLKLMFDGITEPIDDCLSLNGQKCTKLLKLELIITDTVLISDRFFTIFTQFKAIIKLKITLWNEIVLSGSVECFKHCTELKHLIIDYRKLKEDFFANIALFLPKLQSLDIWTKKPIFRFIH